MTIDPRIPTGPIDAPPGRYITVDDRRRILDEILDGVVLGDYDDRVLVSTAMGADYSEFTVLASLMLRCRQAEPLNLGGA